MKTYTSMTDEELDQALMSSQVIRQLYESGLWIARISKSAWHEMRERHRLEDQGLDLRAAEIARLEQEQRVELRRGRRVFHERHVVLSLEDVMRDERSLGELLGVA